MNATPSLPVNIPILDIQRFEHDKTAFVDELGRGYEQWGFAGIANHGIEPELIERARQAFEAFFALPEAVKQRYHVPGGGGARGYTGFGVEKARDAVHVDLKEFWHVGRELPVDHPARQVMPDNLWPVEVADFRPATQALYRALDALGMRVLRAMALYLGLPEDFFESACDHGNSILRGIHYPPVADPDTPSVRAAEHEDINLITLLVGSHQPGLEILSKSGEWVPVTTIEGVIVCNVGDMLQRLTNHVLPSTTHRVVNPAGEDRGRSRYSMPFFLHPNPSFEIRTLESCIEPDNPNRYPEPITADGYLRERLREIGLM